MVGGESRRFKALLFDLYDTLAWLDVQASSRGRQELANRVGVPLDLFLRTWRRSMNDRMLGKGGTLMDHISETVAALGLQPETALVAELAGIERRRLQTSYHLYPSTVPVLQKLATAGYRLGLISNVSDGAALPITFLGVDRLFDDLVLSHQVRLLKPDPAIFELACRRLGATPQESIFVADGAFGELDASHRLGIFSVMLEQDKQSKDFGFSTEYDAKIRDLQELEGLLKRLEAGPRKDENRIDTLGTPTPNP